METCATIYRSINGSPADNMEKILELMGGIETIIGVNDIVIIKPNVQWWNQGAPNIMAVRKLVDSIFKRNGGFSGEVVIAENCHRGSTPWKEAGWARNFDWNSDLAGIKNYGQLAELIKKQYGDRFTVCHWIDIGAGNKRVYTPADGTGYVLCDGTGGVPLISISNGLNNADRREAIMSYPIFRTDRGTVIDLKNGVWERGEYKHESLKLINFAALNHHSNYCGMTSSIKNYFGVVDISGGPETKAGAEVYGRYTNFHMFAYNTWEPGPVAGMMGAEVGMFLNTIQRADLNITSAEWVGLASRVAGPVAHTKAILASKDPVALDYHSAKYVLYPNSKAWIHNPDNIKGPLYQYLLKCAEVSEYMIDEAMTSIKSFDFKNNRLQNGNDLRIVGDFMLGNDYKTIIKHILLRILRQ